MTLNNKTVDTFAQDVHRRIGELMKLANPTVEEVNRLLFLSIVCDNQARDLRRAAARRAQKIAEARKS